MIDKMSAGEWGLGVGGGEHFFLITFVEREPWRLGQRQKKEEYKILRQITPFAAGL